MSSEIIVAQDLALLLRKLHCHWLTDDHIFVSATLQNSIFLKRLGRANKISGKRREAVLMHGHVPLSSGHSPECLKLLDLSLHSIQAGVCALLAQQLCSQNTQPHSALQHSSHILVQGLQHVVVRG